MSKQAEGEYRKEKDFINNHYGLGDLDHDTALEKGHIYGLMQSYAEQYHKQELERKMPSIKKMETLSEERVGHIPFSKSAVYLKGYRHGYSDYQKLLNK